MKAWPVQDRQSALQRVLDTCLKEGPQLVTRRGRKPQSWFLRTMAAARGSEQTDLKELLLTDIARTDDLFRRGANGGDEWPTSSNVDVRSRHKHYFRAQKGTAPWGCPCVAAEC